MVREAEPPALPATEDPFELLGVTPPLTELELRRAYVRRSKQFRPERAPDEFMRVRRAYEQALSRLRWSIYDAAPEPDGPERSEADGKEEDAAGPAAAENLVAPTIGGADDLIQALLDRRPVPAEVLERLPAGELDRTARDRRLDWSVLRDQPDRWLGLELYRIRLEHLVMNDELGRLLDEICSETVRRDLVAVSPLEAVVARGLAACSWSADPRADALFALLGGGERAEQEPLLEVYASARPLAGGWAALAEVRACPPLRRFVERFAAVSHHHQRELVRDLEEALDGEPLAVIAALDAMGKLDARLLYHVHIVTDGMVYGEDLDFEDLAPREQAYIAHSMKTIELATRTGARPDRPWFLIVGGIGYFLGKLTVGGRWGSILGVTLAVLAGIPFLIRRWAETARDVRARLADAVIATGLRPDRMLDWHGPGDQKRPELFGADDSLRNDLVLHTLARLARLARQWTS